MKLIDTHTHIYLPEFEGDRAEMVSRARSAGVDRFLLPAIDSTTHATMMALEAEFPGCQAMIGLHPCSVNQQFREELELVRDWLRKRSFVAIGETGLDFYWDKTYVEFQYESFRTQIGLCLEYDLPVVIHSRNAIDECIQVVSEYPGLRGVFHCFSGNLAQARRILDLGLFLGIGGVVTFKNAGLDSVITATGLSQVVLETDAPYLAPVPYRGKRNEPAYTLLVAEKLAAITGSTPEKVAELTTENAGRLFRL
ncbi:MAG TPA: TatD family hydrolase [Flavisolibacter sp.]